ncbi:TetR/AcrR family transcriptional regulator [Saccharomonospora viridis]|jgi:AcrR family transcriptional regulator|uniref:TetR/AcrR family transcriptional regulator n=1 Tax=Saccharomonospora viridis TaxID=1852 RepID=UPI0024A8522F|nr:TetR/AcrR family transcriptional regulator C-terminal domain-containing protein [Saccharomonospora viridis]
MSYWLAEPRGRVRRRVLTGTALADAAVEILDGEGPEALSMRRVAELLGVAQSSLYGHVRGRDDLRDLALDRVLGRELDGLLADAGDDVVALAVNWFDHLVRHPWAAPLVLERTPLGPSYLALADELCRLLAEAGVPAHEVLGRSYSITALVAGHAIAHENARRARRAGLGYEAVELSSSPHLASAVSGFAGGWPDVVRRGVEALSRCAVGPKQVD